MYSKSMDSPGITYLTVLINSILKYMYANINTSYYVT